MDSLRIFIVDDDVDFAEALAEVVEVEGYYVECAHTGGEAVARIRENDFDITFMDFKLPDMNGIESLFEIRRLKPDAKVMMIGFSIELLPQQAAEGGAIGVLHKPFAPAALLAAIEAMMTEAR